nr:carboxymuconolactone decarboxylase family protein [Methanobacterium formicicum]
MERNSGENKNPFQIFQEEFPDLAGSFNELVDAQRSLPGMDPKTKQLVNIAIQTANRNLSGLRCIQSWLKAGRFSRRDIRSGSYEPPSFRSCIGVGLSSRCN